MKKSLVLIVIIAFSLFSCSKSDDGEIAQSSIVGKWRLVSVEQYGKLLPLTACDLSGYVELFANNTFVQAYGEYNGSTCVIVTDNSTYTLVDNILVIEETYANGGTYVSNSYVKFITPTKFTLKNYYLKEGKDILNIPESEQETVTFEKFK
jgi:hypothetical protein